MHDPSLIATIAAGFTCAWLLGLLTQRLGLSPIVGYLVAGILIGPHSPGFVGDVKIAQQLAEIGVILLMFGVGLHFHLKDLLAVKGVAIPGAIGQSVVATLLAVVVFREFGMEVKTAAVMGMAMAVASTVVLMRVLMDANLLDTRAGHVAVGWLIVEDIFTVVLLVLIPVMGASAVADGAETVRPGLWPTLGMAVFKLAALVAVVLLAGSRLIPGVLVRVAKLRSRELFTLTVLVFSIAVAAGSYYLFGASMALGAFLAGMVVSQSPVSHQAAADALPMRDAFAVIFFVSVGMLFDPAVLLAEPLMLAAALGIILVAKPLAALLIVSLLGHSASIGLTVALGLAQIGEFSFIVAELARAHGLMPEAGHSVLIAAAILSITLNPLIFRALPRLEAGLRKRPFLWLLVNGLADRRARRFNASAGAAIEASPSQAGLAVVIGYSPVGQSVNRLLRDAGLETVVVDLDVDKVALLGSKGQSAIFGDATRESILEQAGVRRATHVVSTITQAEGRAAIVAHVRNLNPEARILVRARHLRERDDLEHAGATLVVFDEAEAAVALARVVLADAGVHRAAAERKVHDLRLHLIQENMSNIRTQRVRSVMVPWTRVRRLPSTASKAEVLQTIAEHRFSRWPVIEPNSSRAIGYLLAKDLISAAASEREWTSMVRPLTSIRADDDVGSTLNRMQAEGSTIYQVVDAESPVGLITLEDILEQVVGRIEDEYPHEAGPSLLDAVAAGGVVLELPTGTRDESIRELARHVPASKLPPGVDIAALAVAREAEVSTDLGVGVAVPHARCPDLRAPLIVLGRSADGVLFSPRSPELVRLVFLLVTAEDQPDEQLSLLAQVARLASEPRRREQLLRARTATEVLDLLAESAQPGRASRGEFERSARP